MTNTTVNGAPYVSGTNFNVTTTTDFAVQYTFQGNVVHYVVTVDPVAHTLSGFTTMAGPAPVAAAPVAAAEAEEEDTGPTVTETQTVIATSIQNRANHVLSNQPDITGFITGANTQGGGAAGNLALNATTGSQVLAFSTSRSKLLSGVRNAHARALAGVYGEHIGETERVSDPLAVLARQASDLPGSSVSTSSSLPSQSYGLGGDTLDLESGADLIAKQRQAADAVIDEEGNVLAPASRAGTFDVWTEIYGSNTNAGSSDSTLWVGYLGAHYFIDDNTLFGVLGQIDWSDETNAAVNSSADGKGWAIGPYIAGQLPGQNLFYEARASWGTSDNDVSPDGTFTDNFDTTRWLLSGKVSGSFAYNAYTIAPSVSVAYYEETQESYTDTNNNLIGEQTISLGEVRFGPEISRTIELDDGTIFTPSVGIAGVYNFDIADNVASQGFALGNDDVRARVDAGFSATNPDNGLTLSIEGFYDGIGINNFDSYGGRARVTIPLN